MPCPALPDGFDFTDPDLLPAPRPAPGVRRSCGRPHPVWWNAQPHGIAGFEDEGYWAVTRHADVKYVSTHPELFSSNLNTAIIRFNEHIERDADRRPEADHAEHGPARAHPGPPDRAARLHPARHPRPGGRPARPRARRSSRPRWRRRHDGSFDFVTDVACELPLQAIAELIGIPQEDRAKIFDWSNKMIAYDDPEYAITEEVGAESAMELISLRDEPRRRPQGVPGQGHRQPRWSRRRTRATSAPTSSASSCCCWPSPATRPPATPSRHGMHAFLTHPDQWELYKRERPATAAEEIVRWATPVVSFQRTATQDTELGGAADQEGRPGRDLLLLRQQRPRGLRRTRRSSTSPATPTPTSASAAAARTSASASPWPSWRST